MHMHISSLWIKCLICIVLVETLGLLSGWATASSIRGWYDELVKPPGTPPDRVFGPVWTLLYAAMGIALARVLHFAAGGPEKKRALVWFGIQFFLNLAWTPVFFGFHQIGAALAVIAMLVISLAVTIRAFRRIDRPAALLLAPYFLWVCYATYLNAGFSVLNRGL